MTNSEYFRGTGFPTWEDQPLCKAMVGQPIPKSLNLDDKYVRPRNNGYLLQKEAQDYVGTCVACAFTTATQITTAAQWGPDKVWGDPSVEWFYGAGRAMQRASEWNHDKMGLRPSIAASLATQKGLVLRQLYPGYDLRFQKPAQALAWENVPPPASLKPQVRVRDCYRITTLDGIARSVMAGRAVCTPLSWAWVQTIKGGVALKWPIKSNHALCIYGIANDYSADVKGLYFLAQTSFRTKVLTGPDSPMGSGRGSALIQLDPLDVIQAITGNFTISVGPMVKA